MVNVGDLLAVLRLQNELSPAISAAVSDLEKLDKAAKMSAYQLTLLGRGMTEAGVIATAAFTVPITAAAKAVIDFATGFETQMTRVVTLAGAPREQIDGMRDSVLKLAGETAVAPAELAKGLYVLMSTGQTTAEAMETLRVSAQMTALGMGDMHDTTLAITGAMFAYRDTNLTAAEAANVLIKAVQLGNMEIQDLVPSIARVNPVAAALGVTFQDVAAGMATFTHAGVDSAVAATGMRAMLSNILTDSAKTEKGFKELAKALNDSSISMVNFRQEMKDKGFTTAMVDLMNRVTEAGDKGVTAINKIFPNIRALTEALFVFKTNGGMVTNMMTDMGDGVDELDRATKELRKTFDFQWNQIVVQFQAVAIELGTELLPVMKAFVATIKDVVIPIVGALVKAFNALPTPVQMALLAIVGFLAAIGPPLIFFGQLLMAIGNMQRALPLLTKGFEFFATSIGLTEAALIPLLGQIGLVIGATLALISIVQDIHEYMGNWRDTLLLLAVPFGPLLMYLGRLAESLGLNTQFFRDIAAIIRDIVIIAFNELKEAIKEGIDTIKLWATIGIALIDAFTKVVIDRLGAALKVIAIANPTLAAALAAALAELSKLPGQLKTVEDAVHRTREMMDRLAGITDKMTFSARDLVDGAQGVKGQMGEMGNAARVAGPPVQSLLDKVRALTDEQKDQIDSLKAQGLTIRQIAEETGIAADVVGVYERQVSGAAAAQSRLNKEQRDALAIEKDLTRIQELQNDRMMKTMKLLEDVRKEFQKNQDALAKASGEALAGQLVAIKEFTDKEADLSNTALQQKLVDIERERDAAIRGLKDKADFESRFYNEARTKINAYYDHLKRVALGSFDTLDERMRANGHFTQQELDEIARQAEMDYERMIAAGDKWSLEAVEAMRRVRDAAREAARGFKDFETIIRDALKNLPKTIMDAFIGGGGLLGALKAFAVSLGAAFAENLMDSIRAAIIKNKLDPKILTGSNVAMAGGLGVLTGGAAIAGGASAGSALGQVGLVAASVTASAAIAVGALTASTIALGAATFGIGAAAVGIGVLARHWLGVSEEVKKAREATREFEDQLIQTLNRQQLAEAGSERWRAVAIAVRDTFLSMGYSAEEAEKAVLQLWNTNNPRAAEAARQQIALVAAMDATKKSVMSLVQEYLGAGVIIPDALEDSITQLVRMGVLTEENATEMLNLGRVAQLVFDSSRKGARDVNEALQTYGLTLESAGAAVQQLDFSERAAIIAQDFEMLTRAGVDFSTLMQDAWVDIEDAEGNVTRENRSMRVSLQGLVTEALTTGRAIPEALRPILEQMIEAGLLVDENGVKLEDLGNIEFEKPLTRAIDELIKKLDELIAKFISVGNTKVPPVQIPVDVEPFPGQEPLPQAQGGEYLVTKPTLFLAGEAGTERASFSGANRVGGPPSSGGGTITIVTKTYLDGRQIAESVAPELPGVIREFGLT